MALFKIQRDVMSGQCKGALARIQVRYTALFIGTGWIRGWAGSQIGLFTPRKTENGYRCTACGSPVRAGKKHVTRKDVFRDGRMQPTVMFVGGS